MKFSILNAIKKKKKTSDSDSQISDTSSESVSYISSNQRI